MSLISQPGSDYQLTEITLDLGRARDITHLLIDVHGLLSDLCPHGTRPEITALAETCLHDCDSLYSLAALISALDEVITQLTQAMRDATATITPPRTPPGGPARF
jgi:hypothetical protein